MIEIRHKSSSSSVFGMLFYESDFFLARKPAVLIATQLPSLNYF